MDQGGKLARSLALLDLVLWKHNYTMEMTGSDSPLQNGAVEVYNHKLTICVHTLLYRYGLLALLAKLDVGMSKQGSKRQTCVCQANMS
jgi:hypothetical protein